MIELQSHSTVSDGQLAPAEVVAEAAKAGVSTLALTDHDAIAGVAEAAETAEELGIELVPAIEMSCVHEYAEDLHVCGYWVDLGAIAPACERAQHERVARAGEIVGKLRGEGFDLHLEDAVKEAGDALSIGRPHIARAAGATGDLGPFFEEYLVPGAKAFVPRRWPTAEQAVEVIKQAGGIAVVAHPYWDISDPAEVEELIRALDVDGVETFYPTHSKEQTKHLLELCDELDLIPTASSDYHGPTHKTFAKFGAYSTYDLGDPQVPRREGRYPLAYALWRRSTITFSCVRGRPPVGVKVTTARIRPLPWRLRKWRSRTLGLTGSCTVVACRGPRVRRRKPRPVSFSLPGPGTRTRSVAKPLPRFSRRPAKRNLFEGALGRN